MTTPVEAEKAVIGALLLQPGKVRETITHVAPGDFGSPVLGALYVLITTRHATGEATDPVTLWPAVKADPILSRNLTSATQLHDLMQDTPTAANVGYYARIVADAGQSRRLRAAAQRFIQLADATGMPAAEKLTVARSELDSIASDYAQAIDVPTLADILATPDEEVDWVIPGLLSRRDRFVLTGEEGFGKTTWFRQIMICAAAGIHPINFTAMPPAKVLVIDTENDQGQWRWETRGMARLAARYGARDGSTEIHVHCTGRMNITRERDIGLVHALVDQYRPDLLAIGPLYKLSPEGMNSDKDASPVIAALDSVRDRPDGPALLMEAHAGHAVGGDGLRALRPRGSSMQLGWPEFGVGIAKDPDDDTGTVAVVRRWRGARIRGRHIPTRLRSGGEWPWMEDGSGASWVALKARTDQSQQRYA